MIEHWAIYDVVSGEFIYGGNGPPGSLSIQELGEGRAAARVPQMALLPENRLDLELVKNMVTGQVDAGAEMFRQGFITPGEGQALTYQYKAAEALGYLADNTFPTPFLVAEAEALEVSVADLAQEVANQVYAWVEVGKRIEARRRLANKTVRAAENLGGVLAAARIDWAGLLS